MQLDVTATAPPTKPPEVPLTAMFLAALVTVAVFDNAFPNPEPKPPETKPQTAVVPSPSLSGLSSIILVANFPAVPAPALAAAEPVICTVV